MKAVDLNRQIQDIIRVNDTAKTNQALKLAELQSVQEQLEIHQRILKTLEVVKPVTPPVSRNDVDEILRQEKIRLIHEQTARNSQIVKTLEQQRRS